MALARARVWARARARARSSLVKTYMIAHAILNVLSILKGLDVSPAAG